MRKVITVTKRVVLLNALPLNAIPYVRFAIQVNRLSPDAFEYSILEDVERGYQVISFIRHKATVDLLSEMLGIKIETSNELYKYQESDLIYIVTLRSDRIVRGQEATDLKPEDLAYYYVAIAEGVWL
jgi:hypothetical protein